MERDIATDFSQRNGANPDRVRSRRANRKVVHLTTSHTANDARIWEKECQTLAEAGYDVEFVAPHDRNETAGQVAIRAIPKPEGRFDRFVKAPLYVYREALRRDAALYHFHDPEFLPYAVLLRLQGYKVIYDSHEDIPKDVMGRTWIPPALRGPISRTFDVFERWAARRFSAIVTATSEIRERHADGPVPAVTVYNFPIQEKLQADDAPPYRERRNQVAYVGSLDEWRGIGEIVRAIDEVDADFDPSLALAGKFTSPNFKKRVTGEAGWKHVDFRGWCSRDEVSELLTTSRCGLVVMHPTPSHMETMPVKLFEYMSVGIPVIATDLPKWREIIEGSGCGILVDPYDVDEIADAIEWMFEHPEEAEAMGRRGRQAIEEVYRWSNEGAKLIDLYDDLLSV